MPFKVISNPTFTHELKVKSPADGGFRDETMRVTYRVMPADEAATYDLSNGAQSTAFLRKVLVRIDDLVDELGTPVSYSDAVRDQLLNLRWVRLAIARGYFDAVGAAALGN